MTRLSSGTPLSTSATKTLRCRAVSSSSTARCSAASRSRHSASCAGSKPNRPGSRSQSSASNGTLGWRQKCRPIFAETSKMTNLYAQVVNRLSPRNCPSLPVMAISASAAAWWARSSSSGPVTCNRGPRRRASLRAIRTSILCSRDSAASRRGPASASTRSHSAESASSPAAATGVCSTPESPGTMTTMLPSCPSSAPFRRNPGGYSARRVELALFDRDGGGEDFLTEGRHGGPPVGPDGVDRAVHGGDALVVPVLVVQLSAAAGLVGGRGRDLHVLAEGQASVGRPCVEDVRAQVRRVVAGVVPGQVHRAVGLVDREPLVELVVGDPGGIVVHPQRGAPGAAAVGGPGHEDVGAVGRGLVHPRAVQVAAVRAGAGVGSARGVHQGAPDVLGRDGEVEWHLGRGDGVGGPKALAAIGRARLHDLVAD